jgi:hypothetical protein
MKPACEQIREWLDDLDRRPLPAGLKTHAASCAACRANVAAEEALRDGLGAAAPLAPAHRAAILAHVLAKPAAAPRRRSFAGKLLRWSWAPLAAAAAIVLAVFLAQPQTPRTPILPTDLFGDFLGPLANLVPPESAPQAPAGADASAMDSVLATFWGDFEGPLAVAQGAMEAPRIAAGLTPAAQNPKQ